MATSHLIAQLLSGSTPYDDRRTVAIRMPGLLVTVDAMNEVYEAVTRLIDLVPAFFGSDGKQPKIDIAHDPNQPFDREGFQVSFTRPDTVEKAYASVGLEAAFPRHLVFMEPLFNLTPNLLVVRRNECRWVAAVAGMMWGYIDKRWPEPPGERSAYEGMRVMVGRNANNDQRHIGDSIERGLNRGRDFMAEHYDALLALHGPAAVIAPPVVPDRPAHWGAW